MHTSRSEPKLARLTLAVTLGLCLAAGTVAYSPTASAQSEVKRYDLRAGTLDDALTQFGLQSGLQVLAPPELVAGHRAPAVSGTFSTDAVLQKLLSGTGLGWDLVNGKTVVLKKVAPAAPAQRPVPATQNAAPDDKVSTLPEILVVGTRSLNTDIERTRDDPQPWVTFSKEAILQSGATNLEDFLKQRLSMNTQGATTAQNTSSFGTASSFNLRGLGSNQTLILIDGRRLGDWNAIDTPAQGDVNGIPLAAVERIEVLPTTASGIYGGGATGGVINIILRRDYVGSEVKLTYDNTFDTDTARRRVDLASGFSFNEGRTNLLLVGNYSDSNTLRVGDRDLIQQYTVRRVNNNPSSNFASFPPLASTPNIRSTTGENLILDDGTALNSFFTSVPSGYGGFATDNGAALVTNAGRYNLQLANTVQQGGGFAPGERFTVLTVPTIKSLMGTLRHDFSERLQVFLDVEASDTLDRSYSADIASFFTLAADAPNNPFRQSVNVSVPISIEESVSRAERSSRRAVAGVIAALPGQWRALADFTWSRFGFELTSQPVYPFLDAAVANDAIDIIRDPVTFPTSALLPVEGNATTTPYRATLRDTSIRFAGPAFSVPGGPATLTVRLDNREETFEEGRQFVPAANILVINPARDQNVQSAYAELLLPLISGKNARPGFAELELLLSGRYDRYNINGVTSTIFTGPDFPPPPPIERSTTTLDSANPTVALRWKFNPSLAFRASYGTGFLPPSVNQILPIASSGPITVTDPLRGDSTYSLPAGAVLTSGNPDLDPEKSKSWSAGLIATPSFVPGLRLSVDYTRIDKSDNIASFPGGEAGLLDNESLVPGRIVRGPKLPGDPEGFAGPITFIDNTLINLSRAHVSAYDVQADYSLDSNRYGKFDFYAVATWQTHYKTQVTPIAPLIENVGFTSNNPLRFKANAGAVWTKGPWKVGWDVRYFDSYRAFTANAAVAGTNANAILNQGNGGRVDSQIYHDAHASYRFEQPVDREGRLVDYTELRFGVKNLFNAKPPYDATFGPFYYSPYGDVRLASYWISLAVGF